MENFESWFSAQVAMFSSISSTTKLPECITAIMLLSNPDIDDAQRVSVVKAAATFNENLNSHSSNDAFLSSITCQTVYSVIKQCYKTPNPSRETGLLTAGSAGTNRFRVPHHCINNPYKRYPPSMKCPCDVCGKYGHCKLNHIPEGLLPIVYQVVWCSFYVECT